MLSRKGQPLRLLDLLETLARQHGAVFTVSFSHDRSTVTWKVPRRRIERISATDVSLATLLFALVKRLMLHGDVSAADIVHEVTRGQVV
jgi:hypothetical protein